MLKGKKIVKAWLKKNARVYLSAIAVATFVILLRLTGLLQSSELAALDQLFRLRPPELADPRLAIVEINEADLQKIGRWPLPDEVMAKILQKIDSYDPRAIGLDVYRDFPVPPGHNQFVQTVANIPNLIGIEKLPDTSSFGVAPPPVLAQSQRIGFNNVVLDPDGKVRRNVLFWHINDKPHTSFSLKLAKVYLKQQGITAKPAKVNPNYMQLGQAVFRPLKPNDGAYIRADTHGYQISTNFRTGADFRTISITDLLSDRADPTWLRDRIVLIGSTAPSLQDLFYYPYSSRLIGASTPIPGVKLHAHFISQILDAAEASRPLLRTWSEPVEGLWILLWSGIGASLIWHWRRSSQSALVLFLAVVVLIGVAYLALLGGWWIPLIPPLLTSIGAAIVILSHLAHREEEFKRSKEFLQTIINTIPDPVFVKDKDHRWLILNQAYCEFVNYPLGKLIDRSDYEIFPKHEAEVFWTQDEQVFRTGSMSENEEEFTDSQGNVHLSATKRSLHRDAAGNLFLVGVIRDITERKRIEEELKQTAAELLRSNAELKRSEDRLRYLAYHDALTGLANRKQFHESLSQSLEWANHNHKLVALLFLDLDGFKQVNDTLGHNIGDLLLKAVAQRLKSGLRGSDTISRLGGDEFTVILPGIIKVEDAERVAKKILSSLSTPFLIQGNTVFVTVSIGISVYPQCGEGVDTLVKSADTAMYRAKELGRNQYQLSSSR